MDGCFIIHLFTGEPLIKQLADDKGLGEFRLEIEDADFIYIKFYLNESEGKNPVSPCSILV